MYRLESDQFNHIFIYIIQIDLLHIFIDDSLMRGFESMGVSLKILCYFWNINDEKLMIWDIMDNFQEI